MCRSARSSRWIFWCLAGFVAMTAPRPAGAVCNGIWPPGFGQVAPNCNGGYCYIVTPGYGTAQSLAGSFWSYGTGRPSVGLGDDNGSLPLDSWLHPQGPSHYVAGDWQAAGVDGCITGKIAPGKQAEIMVALVSDEGFTGLAREGFFAVASATRVANADPEFDFTFVNGGGVARDVDLVSIPAVGISGSSRPPTYVFSAPALSDVSSGIYGDGSLLPEEIAKGYRIYVTTGSVTSLRRSSGWTAISGILPLGQGFTIDMPCAGPGGMYFAYSLVFDGDFETAHVGRPRHLACRYCPDADGDGFPAIGDPECCPMLETCDCDDTRSSVHPGALEMCDGIDNDCDRIVDNVALPGSVASMQLDKQPATTQLEWTALAVATRYDVVRGDLTALRAFAGSYADSTRTCVADDVTVNRAEDAPDPGPDTGFWYLIRGANCTGVGSFDAPDARQAAPRDAGIAESGHACP